MFLCYALSVRTEKWHIKEYTLLPLRLPFLSSSSKSFYFFFFVFFFLLLLFLPNLIAVVRCTFSSEWEPRSVIDPYLVAIQRFPSGSRRDSLIIFLTAIWKVEVRQQRREDFSDSCRIRIQCNLVQTRNVFRPRSSVISYL